MPRRPRIDTKFSRKFFSPAADLYPDCTRQYNCTSNSDLHPEDGVTYTHLTNDITLPPYLLVLLYNHRWDIEKIFYQLNSKMKERKSRASATEVKENDAIFECPAHNLLLLWEETVIQEEEELRAEVERKRKLGRKSPASGQADPVTVVRNFVNSAVTRATHRTQRFIRWVRNRIYQHVPRIESPARLRKIRGISP